MVPEFANEPLTDFTKSENKQAMETALQKVRDEFGRDYPLVMGMILVYGVFTLVCNLIADLVYCWLDPRVRPA